MKKITKILLVAIGIILLTGCGKDSLQEISYNDLEKALNNKETFILEIAQDGCHNCEEFNPIFKKVLKKYNLTAKQINLTKLSEEENTKIKNLYNITGTPTVIFIEKGEEPSISRRIIGARDEDFIITKLGIAGYINPMSNMGLFFYLILLSIILCTAFFASLVLILSQRLFNSS